MIRNVLRKLDENNFMLTIKNPITKEQIIELFLGEEIDIKNLIKNFNGEFDTGKVEYIEFDEGVLFIFKKKKNYFITLKSENIYSLYINDEEKSYNYWENEFEKGNDINRVKEFIDYLRDIKNNHTYRVLYDIYDLYFSLSLIDESSHKLIIEDNEIALMLPNFRDEKAPWMLLSIVLRNTKENIGTIEFNLKDDNFCYKGNVSYFLKELYRHKGYATRALKMVKQLVREYNGDVDRCLYISILKDNDDSQQVVLNNGGKLFYEGEVPRGDNLRIYDKVDYVKIYTIDVNNI